MIKEAAALSWALSPEFTLRREVFRVFSAGFGGIHFFYNQLSLL